MKYCHFWAIFEDLFINTRIPPFVMEHPVVTCCKWVSLYCHIQNYINVTNVRGRVRDTTRCTSELKSEKKCYSGKPQRLKSTFFEKFSNRAAMTEPAEVRKKFQKNVDINQSCNHLYTHFYLTIFPFLTHCVIQFYTLLFVFLIDIWAWILIWDIGVR